MDFILNPIITVLAGLYALLGNNIVLAIIALTILIRVALFPLMAKQQRSAQEMQAIQPKLKKLQEKYKNDREALAQAQMQLYREHGINPLMGCLPLLIQLPILIALYQAIIYALAGTPTQLIELSGRLLIPGLDGLVPMGKIWLGMDLTQPPTLNPVWALVLPLLVLVTTWLQSKLTLPAPPPSDDGKPNQMAAMNQSMTTIMPLMFGFFSLSFSVGLSIYFITSNIVGIAQYAAMGKADFGKLIGRPRQTPSDGEPAGGMVEGKVKVKTSERGGKPKALARTPVKSSGTRAKTTGKTSRAK